MADRGRTVEQVRSEIASERDGLATAVETLRAEVGEAADIGGKIGARLPLVAGVAVVGGFVLAGGIGATMRLLARKGREGTEKARVGPVSVVTRRR
jgi:hypothetical protein